MPGQGLAPEGMRVTLLDQLLVLLEIEKSLGKLIKILFSVPAEAAEGWAQIVPERKALAVCWLSLT
jgi:hypothetical protein